MTRLIALLAGLLLVALVSGCHLDQLLNPDPPPPQEPCYMNAYVVRNRVDTLWLGTVEVPCEQE